MTTRPPRPFAWSRALAGVALFACAYAVANRFQLVHGVLYRWAANAEGQAIATFGWLSIQALCLLGALALLPRKWAFGVLALVFVSVLVNLGYGQTVNDTLNVARVSWMGTEARQAGHAAGEFAAPLLWAGVQAVAAAALFWLAHLLLRAKARLSAGLALFLAPSIAAMATGLPLASGAERNLWHLGWQVLTAPPPPPRAPVDMVPDTAGTPDHVLWLIDESVARSQFAQVVLPSTAPLSPVDFGEAVSLGNCSAPANLALRSGVDVRHAGPNMDLRRTPSVWAYARKAGYRTMLIDGQTTGAPQNLLLPPELALIDEVRSMGDGIETDRRIAAFLNRQLKAPGRTFTYVVLRGVHFQYRDHYPPGTLPDDAPEIDQYRAALNYSKRDFFRILLDGVDRTRAAVVYTSDHGQNLVPGKLPHCSPQEVPAEYLVPLLAFLPPDLAARYPDASLALHSASQILPTTLEWMGYDPAEAQRRYDNDLGKRPLAYVRFGRGVVPVEKGDRVEVEVGPAFP